MSGVSASHGELADMIMTPSKAADVKRCKGSSGGGGKGGGRGGLSAVRGGVDKRQGGRDLGGRWASRARYTTCTYINPLLGDYTPTVQGASDALCMYLTNLHMA